MSDIIKSLPYRGYTINVCRDEDAQNPRTEFDEATVMICFHRRYNLGDKHDYKFQDYSGWDELEAQILKDHDVLIIKPLYMYDHSGITIRTSPFSCGWDSGQIGFVLITKKEVRESFGVKRISKKTKEKADKLLEAEVQNYDDYLTGAVYGYTVTDPNDIDTDMSCWGYYGDDGYNDDGYMVKEAQSQIDYAIENPKVVGDPNQLELAINA